MRRLLHTFFFFWNLYAFPPKGGIGYEAETFAYYVGTVLIHNHQSAPT